MSYPKIQRKKAVGRTGVCLRALGAMALFVLSFALLPATMASAEGASIGVFIDQPTTTLPPATTVPPSSPTPVTTTPTPTTVPITSVTVPETTQQTLPDVLPPQEEVTSSNDTGVIATAKKVANGTKRVVSDVISGKPLADAVDAVLPQSAADVVVPAVRTASTFVFPIGLAGAVIAFLGLQQRIDAGDPKLTAAPLAHDDDEVKFL